MRRWFCPPRLQQSGLWVALSTWLLWAAQARDACTLHARGCRYQVRLHETCSKHARPRARGLQNDGVTGRGLRNDDVTGRGLQNDDVTGRGLQNDDVTGRVHHVERLMKIMSITNSNQLRRLDDKMTQIIADKIRPGGEHACADRQRDSPRKEDGDLHNEVSVDAVRSLRRGKHGSPPQHKEHELLHKLQDEFSSLRRHLTHSQRKHRELEAHLEQVYAELNRTRDQLHETTRKLEEAHDVIRACHTARSGLEAEVTTVRRELAVSEEKVRRSDDVISKKDRRIMQLTKDNIYLKRELSDTRFLLRLTQRQLQNALRKYHELNVKHEAAVRTLNETRRDLVSCHRGKTMQHCGFEDPRLCGFTQDLDSDWFNWLRRAMGTPSDDTGPDCDHTCGNKRGYYMYVEASAADPGKNAQLVSPRYQGVTDMCVAWYYHMYGQGVGILNVYTRDMKMVIPDKELVPVWRAYGNQGNVWTLATLQVPAEVAQKGYQVIFEVQFGKGYDGDIALDDVSVFDGLCDDMSEILAAPQREAAHNHTEGRRP